jgi:hypothetical protein
MSFATELYTLMTSNSSLNAGVTGIYFQNLPDNFDLKLKYIVYSSSLVDSIDHLAKNNEIDIYTLKVNIIAPDSNTVDTIVGFVRSYMDNLTSGKFRDIKCEQVDNDLEGDREMYVAVIQYKIHYQN